MPKKENSDKKSIEKNIQIMVKEITSPFEQEFGALKADQERLRG